MIKTTKIIDVQSLRNNEPIIYDLLFACVEIQGNDMSYDIYPFEWEPDTYSESMWKRRDSSKKLSLNDAIKYFQEWLIKNRITEADDLMVKIWW